MAKGDLRCIEGRRYRNDPQPDDPHPARRGGRAMMADTITLRCTACGAAADMAADLAERCFGPRPAGTSNADSDGCPRCAPRAGLYPSGWMVAREVAA